LKLIEKNGYDAFNGMSLPPEEQGEKLRIAYEHAKFC